MKGIPQWAKERVVELTNADGEEPLSLGIMEYRHALAFARYIAAHEEPPVDPLHQIAREIVAAHYPEHGPEVLEGGYDSSRRITVAEAALRRGIELAKEQSS